jgi:hypothetical protein
MAFSHVPFDDAKHIVDKLRWAVIDTQTGFGTGDGRLLPPPAQITWLTKEENF